MENGVAKNQFQRGSVLSKDHNTKPKNVDYFKVPDELWVVVERLLPAPPERSGQTTVNTTYLAYIGEQSLYQ
jgi:hypothetical protein